MSTKFDAKGDPFVQTPWNAVSDVPAVLTSLGFTSLPGAGTWFLTYDGATDSWTFAPFPSIPGGLGNYADDTAAAAGGVAINGLYRTASAVKIRVT